MNKEAKKLNERNIYNDWQIAELGDKCFVDFSSNGGRSCLPSWWFIKLIGYKFKNRAWYEDGKMTFSYSDKEDKKSKKIQALTFASNLALIKCHIWVKTPFGGYVSKNTADKVGFKYSKKAIINVKDYQ